MKEDRGVEQDQRGEQDVGVEQGRRADLEEETRRVEELERVNAELAAEIRNLTRGRAERPRSSRVPSTRRVARLTAERDAFEARVEDLEPELERYRQNNRQLREHLDAANAEVERLRGGITGLFRRLRARALRR